MTYGRVDLLEESIYSFITQQYDGQRELIIVNDYPEQKLYFDHPDVKIINLDVTFNYLGQKDNYATQICKYNTVAVWDDDDIALPNHLSNINKFFPNYDLLHWQRGCQVDNKKIVKISSLGNSGIVYTKDIWLTSGGYNNNENAGHDMSFVVKLKRDHKCKVITASPPDDEISWFYMWGNRCYHASGQGADEPGRDNIIIRHKRHIENLKNQNKIPLGNIELKPKWRINYSKLLANFIRENNHHSRDA